MIQNIERLVLVDIVMIKKEKNLSVISIKSILILNIEKNKETFSLQTLFRTETYLVILENF